MDNQKKAMQRYVALRERQMARDRERLRLATEAPGIFEEEAHARNCRKNGKIGFIHCNRFYGTRKGGRDNKNENDTKIH